MPVVVKTGTSGTSLKFFQAAYLTAIGYHRKQVSKALKLGNSTLAGYTKEEEFQDLLKWFRSHLPEITPEILGPKTPATAESPSPDLKTLASKTLQAVSRGLDSEDPRTALQAASLFLQNYVGGDTI